MIGPAAARRGGLWSGSALSLAAQLLAVPCGILTAVFLTHRLGPAAFGLFTLATAVVSWIEWSISALLSRATIRLVSAAEDWRPVGALVLRLHLVLSSVAAVLVWSLAEPLAGLLGEPALATYLRLFSVELPLFSVVQTHKNVITGCGMFQARALVNASRFVTRLVLVVVLVELGLSIEGAILASIGATLVELWLARRHVRPSPRGPCAPLRSFVGYAIPLTLFALTMRLYDRLDLFLLKALGASAEVAGYYGAALNLAALPAVLGVSFSPLLLSALTRLVAEGEVEAARVMGRDALRLVLCSLPLAAVVSGAAPELVTFLYGAEFRAAGPLLEMLSVGGVGLLGVTVAGSILTAFGRPVLVVALTAPMVPLAVTLLLWLVPAEGARGAALAASAVAVLGGAVAGVAVAGATAVRAPLGTLLRALLYSVLAWQAALRWSTPGVLSLLKVALLSLVLLGLTYATELRPGERQALRAWRPR